MRVVVVKVDRANTKTFKLDGVNAFNFVFDGHGFNAFKAYQVGPEKNLPFWRNFTKVSTFTS